jgi:DnaJ homolog subfamily C member 17
MPKDDLMQHAASAVDFYELLGITFETSESDIRRAYRRAALRYHPDKLGKDFDPERFHLLQIAHDVLSDPSAKAAYDNTRNARLQRQRQHELFEGNRRKMKEDLEARERGEASPKRPREEDEMEKEITRLAEEGRRRRREMEKKVSAYDGAPPDVEPTATKSEPAKPFIELEKAAREAEEEDEIARLERRIREAEEAKARRKIEKKARKGGVSSQTDSHGIGSRRTKSPVERAQDTAIPIKSSDTNNLKSEQKIPATPRFSFTPTNPTLARNEFSSTMERLKAAEKQRLEDEIRRQEARTAQ